MEPAAVSAAAAASPSPSPSTFGVASSPKWRDRKQSCDRIRSRASSTRPSQLMTAIVFHGGDGDDSDERLSLLCGSLVMEARGFRACCSLLLFVSPAPAELALPRLSSWCCSLRLMMRVWRAPKVSLQMLVRWKDRSMICGLYCASMSWLATTSLSLSLVTASTVLVVPLPLPLLSPAPASTPLAAAELGYLDLQFLIVRL
mmetsp:Transcript_15727/g.44078  ORF Transcript_15727/g.44078 Transcript_15727/m.44078 type:complete len:201 (+) Transcript_15727:1697-2299(+)